MLLSFFIATCNWDIIPVKIRHMNAGMAGALF